MNSTFQIEQDYNIVIRESFKYKDNIFFLNILKSNKNLSEFMRIDNGIDKTYWELELNYNILVSENINWKTNFQSLEDIISFIHRTIINNNFEMRILENTLIFIITEIFNKLRLKPKMDIFVLNLKIKKYDSELLTMKIFEENIKNLNKTFSWTDFKATRTDDPMSLIKILEDKVINDIEVKVNDLQTTFKDKIKNIEQDISLKASNNQISLITIKTELINYFNDLVHVKFDKVSNDIKEIKEELLNNSHTLNNFIHKFNEIADENSKKVLLSKENSLRTGFNREKSINCDLYNFNKTIKIIPFGHQPFWYGYIFDDKVFEKGITEVNIRIDNTDESLNFIIGFTYNNTIQNNGYWKTNTSWMFNFKCGSFYNPGISHREVDCYFSSDSIRPTNNDIVTLSFNPVDNSISIKINGVVCAKKQMNFLDDDQKQNLYPCIDIYNVYEYQFSIV